MAETYAEIREFARDFINGGAKSQTEPRKAAIRAAYKTLTGGRLRSNCLTYYIEAIFQILKIMEKKPCRYQLKKGAVLVAFGDASKTMTNANITDELAEWHLKNTRGAASLFAVVPTNPAEQKAVGVVHEKTNLGGTGKPVALESVGNAPNPEIVQTAPDAPPKAEEPPIKPKYKRPTADTVKTFKATKPVKKTPKPRPKKTK